MNSRSSRSEGRISRPWGSEWESSGAGHDDDAAFHRLPVVDLRIKVAAVDQTDDIQLAGAQSFQELGGGVDGDLQGDEGKLPMVVKKGIRKQAFKQRLHESDPQIPAQRLVFKK